MYRAICVLAAVGLICASAKVSLTTRKPIEATQRQFHNEVTIHGLHVTLPTNMKNFPTELVPQP